MIKNELIKLKKGPYFVITFAFTSVLFMFGFIMSLTNNYGLDYTDVSSFYTAGILNSSTGVGNLFLMGFNIFIPVICLFSHAISTKNEKEGYARYVQIRTSRKKYLIAKMISATMATFVIFAIFTVLSAIITSIVFKDNPYNTVYLIMSYINFPPSSLQLFSIENFLVLSIVYFIFSSFLLALLSSFAVLFIYYLPFIKAFAIFIGVPLVVSLALDLLNLHLLNVSFFDFQINSTGSINYLVLKYLIIVIIYVVTLTAILIYKRSNDESIS